MREKERGKAWGREQGKGPRGERDERERGKENAGGGGVESVKEIKEIRRGFVSIFFRLRFLFFF